MGVCVCICIHTKKGIPGGSGKPHICVCACVCVCVHKRVSLGAQVVRNLSAKQETHVPSLDWKAPLEKEMATHYSILAWKIPWTEEPGGLQSMGSQRVGHD